MKKVIRGLPLLLFAYLVQAEKEMYERAGISNKTTVDIIKFFCLTAVVFGLVYSYYTIRRKAIKKLIKSVSEVVFTKINPNGIYRITCFKYADPIQCLWYRLRNFFIDKRKGYKVRRMDKLTKGYLVCYARYTRKRERIIVDNSSISFLVDQGNQGKSEPIVKGFAGKVYVSSGHYEKSLNVGIVNNTVQKLRSSRDLFEAFSRDDMRYCSTDSDLARFSSSEGVASKLSDEEVQQVKDFMSQTNTNLFELMTINNGVHANHFLGFKVYKSSADLDNKRPPWGVVMIDAIDDEDFEIISAAKLQNGNLPLPATASNNSNWINVLLSAFTKIFANIGDL